MATKRHILSVLGAALLRAPIQGLANPIGKAAVRTMNHGLSVDQLDAHEVEPCHVVSLRSIG